MKNITLSADEQLIERARRRAIEEHTTLNERFRHWLEQYVKRENREDAYRNFMDRNKLVDSGGEFSREEMNER